MGNKIKLGVKFGHPKEDKTRVTLKNERNNMEGKRVTNSALDDIMDELHFLRTEHSRFVTRTVKTERSEQRARNDIENYLRWDFPNRAVREAVDIKDSLSQIKLKRNLV